MPRVPPTAPLLVLAVAALACGGSGDSGPRPSPGAATAEVSTIPFTPRPVETGDFVLVSGAGDTLRFHTAATEDGLALSRFRRTPAGVDSVAAVIDPDTREPIASYQRHFTESGDSVVARVAYGTGFEGQARLSVVSPGGGGSENLRTPSPVLDAAQIPLSLDGLAFGEVDTVAFNYVAPFEQAALAARLVVGALDTLRIGGSAVPAWPVGLKVSGLEERYWFAAPPGGYRLLRYRETTRGVTWSRPAPVPATP